jgi:methyl-accepting chemotaxis protein
MKISTKIPLGLGALVLLVLIIGLFAFTSFSQSGTLFNKMDNDTIPKLTGVNEMRQKVSESHVEFMAFLLSGKTSARDNVAGNLRNLENLSLEHLKLISAANTEEKQVAEELVNKIKFFSSSVVDVMDMRTRGSSDEDLLAAEDKTVRPIYDSMMTLLTKQNDIYKSDLTSMREDVKSSQTRGQTIIIVIALIALITGIVLSVFSERRISRPITHLTRAADDISKGEISKPVQKESNDEIGELAEAFERMRVSLKVMIEEESQ